MKKKFEIYIPKEEISAPFEGKHAVFGKVILVERTTPEPRTIDLRYETLPTPPKLS